MIDLGASIQLSLRADLLEEIDKELVGDVESIGIKGNHFKAPLYKIEEAKIRNMRIHPVGIREENLKFVTEETTIYTDSPETLAERDSLRQGRIGMNVLSHSNLFLDFYRERMFACSDLYDRKREGYNLQSFTKIPFEFQNDQVLFKVETDLGPYTFFLDTGCTVTILKSSLVNPADQQNRQSGLPFYHSSKFILGEKDFGSRDLSLFEIASAFKGIDGILGMDFLKNHVVYLDFAKKEIWICEASQAMH